MLKQMHSRTRQNINHTIRNGIKLRELGYEELDILYRMVNMTGNRRHFDNPSLSYYQRFYQAFKEHKKVLYAYLDTEDYRERNERELKELEAKEQELCRLLEENPQSKKNERRLASVRDLNAGGQKADARGRRTVCGTWKRDPAGSGTLCHLSGRDRLPVQRQR